MTKDSGEQSSAQGSSCFKLTWAYLKVSYCDPMMSVIRQQFALNIS